MVKIMLFTKCCFGRVARIIFGENGVSDGEAAIQESGQKTDY